MGKNFIGAFLKVVFSCLLLVSTSQTAMADSDLVLCNTLDSNEAVLNSAVGPNLALYENRGDPFAVVGSQAYVPGAFGNALTLGFGPPYASTARAHNVVLENADEHLDPEQGTVEVWFKQGVEPVPFLRNPYRIFGGYYGLESGIVLQSNGGGLQLQPPRLEFILTFGGVATDVISLSDNQTGYDISDINGKWIHIAAVWDRAGISGSAETMRLYVDGIKVAVSTEQGWGETVGERVDIGGGNDAYIAHAFFVDELKIRSYTKTDFSDRFVGGCGPAGFSIEKRINHRARPTLETAAQLLAGTRYRAEYKVTNNSANRIYNVRVYEGGVLVCDLFALNPGQSKQPNRCASNQNVLLGNNNVPATVTATISGTNQELASRTNAYYTGFNNMPGKLSVTHYVNNKNADTQATAVVVNGGTADVLFRVENTGSIELYRVRTHHDPASPINSGWQQQCFIGTLVPGQIRYCNRTISVTEAGLNKAFGRARGNNANVSATGSVNAANPSYFDVAR